MPGTRAARPTRLLPALALGTAGALVLAGCGGGTESGTGEGASGAEDGSLTVVTSTDVYADLVENVVGDVEGVEVTPIISGNTQDPHSYEATAQDQLTLSRADVVVMNGGGYDAYMATMLEAVDTDPEVLSAVALSGLPGSAEVSDAAHVHDHADHDHGDEEAHADEDSHGEEDSHTEEDDQAGHDHGTFNEHVWYSIPTAEVVVDEVAYHLGELLPGSASALSENAEAYGAELESLHTELDALAEVHAGEQVAATEPVPGWMFEDIGLEVATSTDFLSAVEHGDDVSPIVLQEEIDRISAGDVVLLAYNTQTAGPQADELRAAAESADVPVVDLAETLPDDTDYLTWMADNIAAIEDALGSHDH
ncbi:metal ABC transporter solute-binding protein, Zn/Mn family [Brevibacterium litoralis]|uniref:metal ABC transporter solute-binding protein, Zn/Mn family n=1 Tax=Brevibacterium litoralis TaxID=3138935 RepID=UPI0032EE3976